MATAMGMQRSKSLRVPRELQGEIQLLNSNPDGQMLASCSDDNYCAY